MCGICGIAYNDPRRRVSEDDLRRMGDTLVHRGPDDEGYFASGPAGLGFRRLSIIDLEGGHQPIFNEDQTIALTMNGEIYNFRELRSRLEARGHTFRSGSDAEVLVHLYEESGADLVDDLVGMFAFAILDSRESEPTVLLGRDRLGIKPLYYAETAEGLYWGSEPKAILELQVVPRLLRSRSLLDYLIQGYTLGEPSAWDGVSRLLPAHTLTWQPGQPVKTREYWDLPLDHLREPADSSEILEWLDRVVEDRLVADVALGAFLSGGIDSTAVVTSMCRASNEPVIACTVGFNEKTHDETARARSTGSRLGLRHYTETLDSDPSLAIDTLPWHFDEPHADSSNVPTYLVSRMARRHVKVALSGDGGDETFAGYRRYIHDVAENRLRSTLGRPGQTVFRTLGSAYPKLDWAPRFLRARSFLTNVGTDPAVAYWRSVCQLDRIEALELLHPDLAAHLADYDPFESFRQHYDRPSVEDCLFRAQYADFHTFLPDQILTKVDRASMAVSLEVRVPMLDHRFCGRFAHLPQTQKVARGRGKTALRQALRSRIPTNVLNGTKRGFEMPLRGWLSGPLSSAVGEAIESLPEDWFSRPCLRKKLREHASGRRDHSQLLWSLLVFEHWRRRHGVAGLAE